MKVGTALRNVARTLNFSPAPHLDLSLESLPRECAVENAQDALEELQKMTVEQEHINNCVSELQRVIDHFQDGLIDWRPRGRVEEFNKVSLYLSLASIDLTTSREDEDKSDTLANALACGNTCLATVHQLRHVVEDLELAIKWIYWEDSEKAMSHYKNALHSIIVAEQFESWFMTRKGVYSDYDEYDS